MEARPHVEIEISFDELVKPSFNVAPGPEQFAPGLRQLFCHAQRAYKVSRQLIQCFKSEAASDKGVKRFHLSLIRTNQVGL